MNYIIFIMIFIFVKNSNHSVFQATPLAGAHAVAPMGGASVISVRDI